MKHLHTLANAFPEFNHERKTKRMGDRTKGLYDKFIVTRVDGKSAPGAKHDGCRYFVLDIDHDFHAIAALQAYADSCRTEYPLLAADLDEIVKQQTR